MKKLLIPFAVIIGIFAIVGTYYFVHELLKVKSEADNNQIILNAQSEARKQEYMTLLQRKSEDSIRNIYTNKILQEEINHSSKEAQYLVDEMYQLVKVVPFGADQQRAFKEDMEKLKKMK